MVAAPQYAVTYAAMVRVPTVLCALCGG